MFLYEGCNFCKIVLHFIYLYEAVTMCLYLGLLSQPDQLARQILFFFFYYLAVKLLSYFRVSQQPIWVLIYTAGSL